MLHASRFAHRLYGSPKQRLECGLSEFTCITTGIVVRRQLLELVAFESGQELVHGLTKQGHAAPTGPRGILCIRCPPKRQLCRGLLESILVEAPQLFVRKESVVGRGL